MHEECQDILKVMKKSTTKITIQQGSDSRSMEKSKALQIS